MTWPPATDLGLIKYLFFPQSPITCRILSLTWYSPPFGAFIHPVFFCLIYVIQHFTHETTKSSIKKVYIFLFLWHLATFPLNLFSPLKFQHVFHMIQSSMWARVPGNLQLVLLVSVCWVLFDVAVHPVYPSNGKNKRSWYAGSSVTITSSGGPISHGMLWFNQIQNHLNGPLTYSKCRTGTHQIYLKPVPHIVNIIKSKIHMIEKLHKGTILENVLDSA